MDSGDRNKEKELLPLLLCHKGMLLQTGKNVPHLYFKPFESKKQKQLGMIIHPRRKCAAKGSGTIIFPFRFFVLKKYYLS